MLFRLAYTAAARKDLLAVDAVSIKRILDKLDWFVAQANPLRFAERLQGPFFGQYRFRVGDYRILFDLDQKGVITILVILRIRHRREAYN